MESKKSYEMLLEAQCRNYEKTLHLLSQVKDYDLLLLEETAKHSPDCGALEYVTIQKGRLVRQLDSLSIEMVKVQALIEETAEQFLDGRTHPVYQKLGIIKEIVSSAFDDVLSAEDDAGADIVKNLTTYKERLLLEAEIKKVPRDKRQVFFVKL